MPWFSGQLAVGAEEAFRFDLDKMPNAPPDTQTSGEGRELNKTPWQESSIEQSLQPLAAAG